MSEVSSINSKIRDFLARHESLKSLPKGKILSIMVVQGIITQSDASEYLKNSAFDTGYTSDIDVIPQWRGEKKAFDESLLILNTTVLSARSKLSAQERQEGIISKAVNYFKETFNLENRKSNVDNEINEYEKVIYDLEKSSSPEEFKAKFKAFRGVDFSAAKVLDCREKSEVFNRAQSIKDTVDALKNGLNSSSFNDLNRSIRNTFEVLGIKDEAEISKILKDIESAHKNDEAISDFGGNFRFEKNYYGQYVLRATNKNGKPTLANTMQLKLIAKEMKLRLNKAQAAAMGVAIPENASSEQIEKLTDREFNRIAREYNTAFKDAFGEKNVETLADNYIKSQRQNTAYVQTALDVASIATMFMGGGVVLKGVSLLSKGGKALNAAKTATTAAAKVIPAAVAVQVTRPVDLTENLTSKEPDWKSYGMSVAEGAMWMVLGMVTGGLGDKARMFLGRKGLSSVAKNTGKTIDQLIDMHKSGHKLPANLAKSLNLIENVSKLSGTSAEFTADILVTYAIQAGRGEDLKFMDYIGSANGALMGTVMHKTFAKISDAEKIKVIQKGLLESNPNMTKAELEKASGVLLEVHRLAEGKRAAKVSKPETAPKPDKTEKIAEAKKTSGVKKAENTIAPALVKEGFDKDGKKILLLTEEGEAIARAVADDIHFRAEKIEPEVVNLMQKAGLGISKNNMTHRPKSSQSIYDKIKNAMTDAKHPATFDEAVKSVRDAVGTRTELSDFDYKKHPDIVEMYKTDPKKAMQMASERQSEEYVQKVMNVIKIQAQNPAEAPLSAINISNYMGKDGIPYFSARQVAVLRDYAAQFGIELNVKDKLTKVRPSGYTALQMNFVTKDGFTFEWQLRGSKVNKFAECEHVPYDIREGKDVTGGHDFLEELYAPIKDAVEHLDNNQYDKYNNYLTAHYEHLRKQELGFESTAPKLEDFGLTDPKLKAENLELLHDLAEKLKKGQIDENTARIKYFYGTTAQKMAEKHPDIASRLNELSYLWSGIKDEKILSKLASVMSEVSTDTQLSLHEIFKRTEDMLNLAEIYHAVNGNLTPVVRANGINGKSETVKYLRLLKKNNPSEYNNLIKQPSFLDRLRKKDWSADDRADLHSAEKFQHLIEFISRNSNETELCNYLYKEYYLQKAGLPKDIVKKCLDINERYGVKVIPSQVWLKEPDKYFSQITSELDKWKSASGGKAKFPPAIDALAIKFQYLQGSAGTTSVQNHDIMLNPRQHDLTGTLRHELTHMNDTKFRQIELPQEWKAYRTITYSDGETLRVLDAKNCKYADEFRNAGLDFYIDVPYAFTDADEFIAKAAEGDMSKYSPEFKQVLISLGMPEWVFKLDNDSVINIPPGRLAAENEKFPETDEAFANIIKNRKDDFKALTKIEDMDEFIEQGAKLILSEMGLEGAPIKIEITADLNEFDMDSATLRISRNWTGEGHTAGNGDRAEILGGIAHEMNHFLQNKEIYLNAMLREDEFKYNLAMSDECKNLMLWVLGADDTGRAKFPYPMKQSDYNFNKANEYIENFSNYIEPYKMQETNGKMEYVKDESGNYVIDEESYEAYKRQLVEAESVRRGNIVRDEYKKLINEQ